MIIHHKRKIDWQIISGSIIILAFIIVAIAAPWLAKPPEGEESPSMFKVVGRPLDPTPHPPDEYARLGTLPGQVDVYYTLVWGTRHAIRFGLTVALTTAVIGVVIGAVSGYAGGWLNQLLIRITDGFLTIPVVIGIGIFRQLIFLAEPSA